MEPVLKLLRVAKIVSIEIPVPGLSTALELALNIAEKAKDIKDTRDACRSLAERAARFSLGIYDQLKYCPSDDPSVSTRERVELLILTLRDIENLMRRRGKKRLPAFFGRHKNIARQVQQLNIQLEDAINLFELQTGVNIEQTITGMDLRLFKHVEDTTQLGETLIGVTRGLDTRVLGLAKRLDNSATFDGTFRLFAQENLRLLGPIHDAASQTSRPPTGRTVVQRQPRNVIRYRAVVEAAGELSGTRVVVYTYPRLDDRRFAETISFARQAHDAYFLRVLGYSRPGGDLGEAPFIVTEDYTPIKDFVDSLNRVSKLRVAMQVMADLCEAVDHLDTHGLSGLLDAKYHYCSDAALQYVIKHSDIVWDHQHGGRFKWAGAPQSRNSEWDEDRQQREMVVFSSQAERMAQINFYSVSDADVGILARNWLYEVLLPFGNGRDLISSVFGWHLWGLALGQPQHPLGTWVTYNAADPWSWSALSARVAGLQKTAAYSMLPYALPWQGSGTSHTSAGSQNMTEDEADSEHTLQEKLDAGWVLDAPASDLCEMCIDVAVGASGTRWKRFQVSCAPIGLALLFIQLRRLQASPENISRLVHSAPDLSTVSPNEIGLATLQQYYTETTACIAPHATCEVPPPLWFFLYAQADRDDGTAHDPSIPFGFWSLERDPTSVPEDIAFDPTPRFQHIASNGPKAQLSTWTQTLGDLTFTTQTKMHTQAYFLNEDDLLAFKILQEDHKTACDCDRAHAGEEAGDDADCAAITPWMAEEGEEQSDEEYHDADEYHSEQEGDLEHGH